MAYSGQGFHDSRANPWNLWNEAEMHYECDVSPQVTIHTHIYTLIYT